MNIFELTNNIKDEDKEKEKSLLANKYYNNSVTFGSDNNNLHDIIKSSLNTQYSIDVKTSDKYRKYGITWNPRDAASGSLDIQLADAQSNWQKIGHALEQTVVNEIALGTLTGFADLYDIILGRVFKSDEDYQNPVSAYLENLQEQFREARPIYQDPTKTGWKAWNDFGWWMNNFPSIMSSLTLLIPGAGVGKGVSYLGKLGGKALRKGVSFTRKGAKAAKTANIAEDAVKIGKFENFINRPDVITRANRFVESGTTALVMRLVENYQESRQTYNDMMSDINDSMKNMSAEERADLIERNKELFESLGIDTNDDNQVARAIAKKAADKTFRIDMANLAFDVIQMYTLGNPLKLPKNLRTTAKVNRAQREAKIIAKLGDVEGAKYLANRSNKQKVADWISDNAKAKWLITSSLSEGVEESINYIAQQEGINYGQLMLNPEEANINSSDRFNSYFTNSELYESAFWGVLGGVMFEGGGRQLKRTFNASVNTRKINKQANDETLEGTQRTTWREQYESAENVIRTGEINKRYANLIKLKERRESIFENGESPFDDDSPTPGTKRKLTTQLEKDAAWQRAVDEYLVEQTFLAIDAGNYDLFKEYLRDPDVREVVENIANSDKSNNAKIDVEQLIMRMDEIEKIYTDNLITVNGIAAQIGEVPMEYVNIIARDNTKAQIKAQRLQNRIDRYEASARANEFRFEKSLQDSFGEPTLNYKTAVKLTTATTYLRELRKAKEKILQDKKRKGSIEGQMTLNEINSKIDAITNYVAGLQPALTAIQTDKKLYSVINTLFATHISLDTESNEYFDFTKALATKDISTLSKITGRQFELTDDDIVKVFGEGNADGVFYRLSEEVLSHFGVDKSKGDEAKSKFQESAPNLKDDYETISALELSKLLEESKISNTVKNVRHRIESLNNSMNKARVAAISKSRDIIVEKAKKYGRDKMNDYVFNGTPIEDMSDVDKRELDEAITVLNLTNPVNEELAQIIYWNILIGDYEASVENAEEKENSSTSQKSDTNDGALDPSKPLTEQPKQTTQQNNPIESEKSPENDTETEPIIQNQYIGVSPDVDSGLSFSVTFNKDDNTVPFVEGKRSIQNNEFDTYELQLNDNSVSKELKDKLVSDSNLFDGYDKNNTNEYEITENPILMKDNNGKIRIWSKGTIKYKKDDTISSTGDEEKPIIDDETLSEEEAKKEAEALEKAQKELVFRRSIFGRLRNIAESLRNDNKSRDEIMEAINKEVSKIRSEEGFTTEYNDVIESTINLLTNKYDLAPVAQALNDFRSSTVIEEAAEEGTKFTEEFIKFAHNLIEEYAKANKWQKGSNNKYYINFENFIRNLNSLYRGYEEGSKAYKRLKSFLTSEDNDICILTDDPNDPNILDNARKDVATRLREQIGALDKYRVGTEDLFKANTEKFRKAFDELQVGEKLKLGYDEYGRFAVYHKGTIVGIIGIPKKTDDGNGYIVVNKGWKTDVYPNTKDSNLRKHLSELAKDKQVNDIIFSILYDKMDDDKRDNLKQKAYNILLEKSSNFINTDNIETKEDKENAVDWICNLWRYKITETNFADDVENRGVYVDRFLDDFFEKLYNSYDAINQLKDKGNNIEIEIANINEGEIIRVVESKDIDLTKPRQSRDNYNSFTQSDKAFSKPDECEVGCVIQSGILTLESNKSFDHTKLGVRGTVHVVIPNKNGKPNFVIATSVRVDDNNEGFEKSDAYKIIKEARDYLNNALDKYLQDKSIENFDILVKVINQLMGGVGVTGLFSGVNTRRTENAIIISKSRNKRKLKDSVYLQINKNTLTFEFNSNNENGVQEGRIEGNEQQIKDFINALFNSCFFNVDFDFFTSSVNSNNGLIGYTPDGKNFIIQIQGKPYKYDSVSQAFIKGGLLRVNTKIDNGSNYRRFGKNQDANAILEVSFKAKSSSPIEKNDETSSATSTIEQTTGQEILENEDSNTAVDKLISNALPDLKKSDKKALQNLGLLPKSIIFVDELKDDDGNDAVAQVTISDEQIRVSRLWLDMYDGNGEYYINKNFYRKQAIRKLIHEQLHVRIAEQGREEILRQIKQIYDEFETVYNSNKFKEYIEKYLEETVGSFGKPYVDKIIKDFEKYLFKNKRDLNERLEEFLVESLTSEELSTIMNIIEADWNNVSINIEKGNPKAIKETLWNKIINLIAKIFNYSFTKTDKAGRTRVDINKQSLLQKELYALAGALNTKGEIVEETVDTTEKSNQQQIEEEDDFDGFDISFTGPKDGNRKNSTVIESLVPENIRKQRQEIEREMQDIKSKAIADGRIVLKPDGSFDYALAPNGKRSNLNERQWLQVRTKAFIRWFGDWFTLANLNATKDLRLEWFQMQDWYKQEWKNLFDENPYFAKLYEAFANLIIEQDVNSEDFGFIKLTNENEVKLLKEAGLEQYVDKKYVAVDVANDVQIDLSDNYEDALIDLHQEQKKWKDTDENINLKLETFESVNDEGKKLLNSFRKEDIGQSIYDFVSEIKKLKDNVSKVVDENGEPLEVYHGTLGEFNIFDFTKLGKTTGQGYYIDEITGEKIPIDSSFAFFFTNNKLAARSYKNLAIWQQNQFRAKIYRNLYALFSGNYIGFTKFNDNQKEEQANFINNVVSPYIGFDVRREVNNILHNRSSLTEQQKQKYAEKFKGVANKIEHLADAKSISNRANNLEYDKNALAFLKSHKEDILNNVILDYFRNKDIHVVSRFGSRAKGDVYVTVGIENNSYYAFGIPGTEGMVPITRENFDILIKEIEKGINQNEEDLNKEESEGYYNSKGNILKVFLNIRTPIEHDYENSPFPDKYKNGKHETAYVAARQTNKAKKDGNDGVIYRNIRDPFLMDSYGVFNPNQIKSATDNIGTFSTENNDIRYSTVIESAPTHLSLDSFLNTINPELAPEVARMIDSGELSIMCK